MRVSWAKVALGAVMAAMFIAPISSAVAQQTSDQVRVSVNLKDVDLLRATQELTRLSGLQFVVMPTTDPFNKVTLQLTDMPAEDVIRYMCQSAGAEFRRDENGVYVIGHVVAKPSEVNNTAAPLVKPKLIVKKIKIMKADPKTLYYALLGQQVDPLDAYRNLNRVKEITNPAAPTGLWYNAKESLKPKLSVPVQPISGERFSNPNEASNGISLPGESANQLTPGGSGGGLQGGGNQGGPQGGTGQGGGNVSLAGGQGLIPAGIDFISYDPTDNSFIVQGTDEAIQEFIRILNEFDVAPKQVTIKVEFITTSSSLSKSLGFEFLYARGGVSTGTAPGTFIRATDPIFLNYGLGNVTARLRAQLLQGDGKVVNSPIIRTLNNQPAIINTQTSTTIFINQVIGNGAGSVIISPQPFPLNINTGLAVDPRINNDGTITMALNPQIADFGQLRRGPDGTEIPDQLYQQISVVARVRNGETIVLGGLTRKSDQGSEARVPILADLPIIGQFFRSTTRDRNNSELLIFVTPTVVEDDEGNGINP